MTFFKLIIGSLCLFLCSSVTAESVQGDQNTATADFTYPVKSSIPFAHEHCTQLRDFVKSSPSTEFNGDYLMNGGVPQIRLVTDFFKVSPTEHARPPTITVICPLDTFPRKAYDFTINLFVVYKSRLAHIDSDTLKVAIPLMNFRNEPAHQASFEKDIQECIKGAYDNLVDHLENTQRYTITGNPFGQQIRDVTQPPHGESWELSCSVSHLEYQKTIFEVKMIGFENHSDPQKN